MRIHSIELENFKLFEKKRVDFPAQFSVLIGENGSGKTAVLEAVAGFLEVGIFLPVRISQQEGYRLLGNYWHRYSFDKHANKVFSYSQSLLVRMNVEDGEVVKIEFKNQEYYSRSLQNVESGTTVSARELPVELMHYAENLIRKIALGEEPIVPVLAYFSTKRNFEAANGKVEFVSNGTIFENGYRGALSDTNAGQTHFLSWYKTYQAEHQNFPEKTSVLDQLSCVNGAILLAMNHEGWRNVKYSFAEDDLIFTVQAEAQSESSYKQLRHLSDGYKSVIALVATIAWRCVRLNPHLGETAHLETPGIVLIDELDLHLHPKWQKRIVGDLKRTFPKIQFICTTHSPFIVQSLDADEVIDLDGQIEYSPKELPIEEVATMMGVESPYSIENEQQALLAENYLKAVRGIAEDGRSDDPSEADGHELDELEAKMADPTMRALLKLERLKYKK